VNWTEEEDTTSYIRYQPDDTRLDKATRACYVIMIIVIHVNSFWSSHANVNKQCIFFRRLSAIRECSARRLIVIESALHVTISFVAHEDLIHRSLCASIFTYCMIN